MKYPLFFLCSLLPTLSAFATGSESSGGADYQIHVNAWFTSLEPKTVQACIHRTANFGFDEIKLKTILQKEFEKWAQYTKRVGGLDRYPSDSPQIATQLIIHDQCQGDEDLTVYFGVTNRLIHKRKRHYRSPFAFAETLNPIDMLHPQADWSKGLIWIAPPHSVDRSSQSPIWTNFEGAPLEMTLLHELGHVFGNEHVPNTIMRSDLGNVLDEKTQKYDYFRPKSEFEPLYLEIDQGNFLVYQPELDFKLPLFAGYSNYGNSTAEKAETEKHKVSRMRFAYQQLTGKELTGDSFNAILSKENTHSLSGGALEHFAAIHLDLVSGNEKMQLQFKPTQVIGHSIQTNVLQRRNGQSYHENYSIDGILVRSDQSSFAVNLNINEQLSWISIIDKRVDVKSDYCYNEMGYLMGFCTLLTVDFETMREKLLKP